MIINNCKRVQHDGALIYLSEGEAELGEEGVYGAWGEVEAGDREREREGEVGGGGGGERRRDGEGYG